MAFLSKIVKTNQFYEKDPKIAEEVIFDNIEQNLNKWSIPKIPPTKVYSKECLNISKHVLLR